MSDTHHRPILDIGLSRLEFLRISGKGLAGDHHSTRTTFSFRL